MKVRKGFVSNSSSSSFIIVYDKTSVISNPEEIIAYLKENPNSGVLFRGIDLQNGEDIFSIEKEQERLIRLFPEQFIRNNKDNNVRIYKEGYLRRDPLELFGGKSVDMSDVQHYGWYTKDPKEIEVNKKWYATYTERHEKLKKEALDETYDQYKDILIREGVKEEDIAVERVDIDNCTSNEPFYDSSDKVFAERYLCDSYEELEKEEKKYEKLLRGRKVEGKKNYVIFYNNLLDNKKDILQYIKTYNKDNYIFWQNDIFNATKDDEDILTAFYEVGEEERKILEEKLTSSLKDAYLLTNATIVDKEEGFIPEGESKFMVGRGNLVIKKAGEDLIDFTDELGEVEKLEMIPR